MMTATDTKPKTPARHKNKLGWGKLAKNMLIPFFLATIMGLAYLGAFHQPTPHNLPVAVVGDSAATKVFAQTIKDNAGDALSVQTIKDADAARQLISDRDIAAAFDMGKDGATLMVSSAASETTANITEKIFMPIAYEQHVPFQVEDVVPAGEHDSTGQGIFFLLVALSIGGYASAVPLSGFMSKVKLPTRFALAVLAGAIVAALGTIIAGPIYGVLSQHAFGAWAISWVYATSIIMLGMGLHPMLHHWTTPILTLCFVALNFTSSGGIFTPAVQPGLFAGLNTFWNGAAWLHAVQTVVYFPEQSLGMDLLKLFLWLVPGILLMVLTHAWSVRKTRLANEAEAIKEIEEAVAA